MTYQDEYMAKKLKEQRETQEKFEMLRQELREERNKRKHIEEVFTKLNIKSELPDNYESENEESDI